MSGLNKLFKRKRNVKVCSQEGKRIGNEKMIIMGIPTLEQHSVMGRIYRLNRRNSLKQMRARFDHWKVVDRELFKYENEDVALECRHLRTKDIHYWFKRYGFKSFEKHNRNGKIVRVGLESKVREVRLATALHLNNIIGELNDLGYEIRSKDELKWDFESTDHYDRAIGLKENALTKAYWHLNCYCCMEASFRKHKKGEEVQKTKRWKARDQAKDALTLLQVQQKGEGHILTDLVNDTLTQNEQDSIQLV
jgi:hypothetical protein